MTRRYFNVVLIEETGVETPVDFKVFEDNSELARFARGLNEDYGLREVKYINEVIDILTYWNEIYQDELYNKELVGSVGVDSGQLMITDPCYLSNWKHDTEYEKICEMTSTSEKVGQVGNGFNLALATGYGDGQYDVFVKRDSEGRIINVEIDLGY